jgi:outer membrane protein assembly complex protein YaeT
MWRNSRAWLVAVAFFAFAALTSAATIKISGAGLLRDRELRRSLERLLEVEKKAAFDANALEDAGVILGASLGEEGFQGAKIEIEATLADGTHQRFEFDPTFTKPLPRPLAVPQATFHLVPGVRAHVAEVVFEGLTAVDRNQAEAFFRARTTLLATEKASAYSPSRLNRSAVALLGELQQRGFSQAGVEAEKIREDNGAVTVRVTVRQGPRWEIKSVLYQGGEAPDVKLPEVNEWVGRPWSPTVQVDIRETIRRAYYQEGYPDVGIHVEAEGVETQPGLMEAEVIATVVPGPRVTVGRVRFEGNRRTRESVLRRRVELSPGAPLNPLSLERSRYRISRLGIFDVVDLRYEPPDGTERTPVFTLRELPAYETSLLFGYGSYEQIRGGFEHRQLNIFGLGHQSTLQMIHSAKSTSGDYTYAVPELFGESLDGAAKFFGLQRKEIAFLRQEWGLTLSLKRALRGIGGDATIGYTFKALRNRENSLSTRETDEGQINAATMNFGVTGDRRDNRLRPRRGYHWSAQVEAARPQWGSQTTYERFEISGAYHTGWGGGRWIHVGLSHGAITTLGTDDSGLSVNVRFYPGGDNSIRGYQRGEAAPRGPDGLFIGAKSFLLGNLELEQALTANWSVVGFGDALGTARTLRDYPFNERLYSAGLGIRYQTLIGPLRLEYARNINPRPADPPATWHFSMGYPF